MEATLQEHKLVRTKSGVILVADPVAARLMDLATKATRVKLFDTFQGQSARFLGEKTREVKLGEETYGQFVRYLELNGWKLRPQLTSGGYIATRQQVN